MKKLMNGAQMKMIDTYSIQEVGIPSLVLMERAALCVQSLYALPPSIATVFPFLCPAKSPLRPHFLLVLFR